jgi:intein-encoded DNA endonuclease-like protein
MVRNELFFNEIDNEFKAYWLGFIYGDGCIYQIYDKVYGKLNTGSLNIMLSKKDENHLKKFSDIFSTTLYSNEKRNECRVSICNKNIFYDLKDLGMPERDMKVIIKKVPEKLMNHFIRGLFDADGSVYLRKRIKGTSLGIGIDIVFSNMEIAIDIQNILCKNTSLSKTKIYEYKKQNCFRLTYGGSEMPLFFAN